MIDNATVIRKLLHKIHTLGLTDCYMIVPAISVPGADLIEYWVALENADTLKYRWCDMKNPTAVEVTDRLVDLDHMYNVIDCTTLKVVADFALDTFTGKSAQVHFSIHPDVDGYVKRQMFDMVSDHILKYWKDIVNFKESYLDTLFGLTPVGNRVACVFVLRSSFNKLGILPSGTKYMGKTDDALVTYKTRQ